MQHPIRSKLDLRTSDTDFVFACDCHQNCDLVLFSQESLALRLTRSGIYTRVWTIHDPKVLCGCTPAALRPIYGVGLFLPELSIPPVLRSVYKALNGGPYHFTLRLGFEATEAARLWTCSS